MAGEAETSIDLQDRRDVYKRMDRIGKRLGVRHVPAECTVKALDNESHVPLEVSDDQFQTVYTAATELVRHDDTLNWQKFQNMINMNAGLLAAFSVALSTGMTLILFPLSVIGVVYAWIFDSTLQEGMRCLRAHKAKIALLDKRLGAREKFIFCANPWNNRDALEAGPFLSAILWLVLGVASFTV